MPRRGRRSKLRLEAPVAVPELLSNARGTPVPPIRTVEFRWFTKAGRFIPCRAGAGTLVTPVDHEGWPVMARREDAFGETGSVVVGWELAFPSPKLDPADVRQWFARESQRRRKAK